MSNSEGEVGLNRLNTKVKFIENVQASCCRFFDRAICYERQAFMLIENSF